MILQDAKSVESALEEIIYGEFPQGKTVQSVSIVSKSGLLVAGKAASPSRTETFSAMSAIMYSAAEATKNDVFKDGIDYLMAAFHNTKLFITELSPSLLLVASADRDTEDSAILESMEKVVSRTKADMSWLR